MLYSYYMKIKQTALLFILCASVAPLWAQNAMLVKQQGPVLYMDISALKKPVAKGDTFKIITGKETLINPKTGKNLGDVFTYSNPGTVTEVQKLYAVGEIADAPQFALGAEAVFEDAAPQAAPAQPAAAPDKKHVSDKVQKIYAPVEQTVISLSAGNVSAPGQVITLSQKGVVSVWNPTGEKLAPALQWQLPKTFTPITLSAVDVKETGTAQIFVTYYQAAREQISTAVLENQNNTLVQTHTLPWFVKELGCLPDKELWAQKPFVMGTRPGSAREVDYKHGKFVLDEDRLNTRRNWLTGVNEYELEDDTDSFIYTASNGALRAELKHKRAAESKDIFAGAPNRVKYKQDVLKFYPSVQVYGPKGAATLAAVENTAKIGVLSDMFGMYQSGKIHFLNLQKGRLTITDTVELDGYVYDTTCTANAVLAAEVLPDGSSALREIFK